MAARKSRMRKVGYEPSRGFPEPGDARDDGSFTHSPHRNGTVCGLALTDASAYTVDAPTCPTCLRHFTAVQRSAQRTIAAATALTAEHKAPATK